MVAMWPGSMPDSSDWACANEVVRNCVVDGDRRWGHAECESITRRVL